jgi:hypothetical protein
MKKQGQIFVIFSVDTEHDIISKYTTKTAGWSKGIPLLFEVFDASQVKGKICWLIEYNLKDGILASNAHSELFVKEFPELLTKIKNRGDELGLHPTMYAWLGGGGQSLTSSYDDPQLWDFTRSYHDPEFVINLITSAAKEFRKVCQVNPVGCRTGAFHYATHLATALERNAIYIDSSARKGPTIRKPWHRTTAPNAYYAASDNIYKSSPKTGVLEIPTTGYVCNGWHLSLLKLRTRYLLRQRQPIFLSFFIHNWQAITTDGKVDSCFLDNLYSFLCLLRSYGACFLSWTEAREIYNSIYENGS